MREKMKTKSVRALWDESPTMLRVSVVTLVVTSCVMVLSALIELIAGELRPLSASQVARMTSDGADPKGVIGVVLIFIVFCGGVLVLGLCPVALALLLLQRSREARVVLITLGILICAFAGASNSAPWLATGAAILLAGALAFIPPSNEYFRRD